LHFVNSPLAKSQFNKRLKGIGVPNLHLKEIRDVIVSFPASFEEQSLIISQVDKLLDKRSQLEEVYKQKLKSLDELKKSLLQKAFSGELTQSKGIAV
jgi:type I restriction enzyme S subunit